MGISVGGLSSGIDVDSIISQMISIERRPQVRLQVKEAGLQGKLTSIGAFNQALTSLQSAASSLRDISSLNTLNISSSDTTILTATAGGSVAPGTHQIEVKQLAQVQRLASTGFADITTTAVGTGTLTIQVGTGTSGVVTIDSTNNTLTGLRDAINNSNAGVSASILNDGTNNKLIITANNSGSGNTIKITAVDDDGNNTDMNGLSRFVYDTASAVTNLTQTQAAQNATLKVDGIDNISKGSNAVSDVIQGVTVNLLKAQIGTTVNLNVTQDNSSAKSKIQGFVDEYNKLVKLLNGLQGYDAKTKKGGVLLGDSVVSGIRQKIRNVMTGQVSNLSGSYTSLAQIGIKSSSDGTLTIDSTKLDSALSTNFTAVGKLFAKNAAITDPNITLKGTTINTKSGIYSINITQAAAKGRYTGTALTLPLTIT
ncbi:MAG: flagellar filament capping protein FliD, partial [Nitrospirota bacterium]